MLRSKVFKNNVTFILLLEPDGDAVVSKAIPGTAGVRALQVQCRHHLDDGCSSDRDLFTQLMRIYLRIGPGNEMQRSLTDMKTLAVTSAERLTLECQSVVESFSPRFHPR